MTNRLVLSLALTGLVAAAPAAADVLTPVGVTASSTFNNGFYTPQNLINGSGLSGGQHDNFFGNMWQTEQGVAYSAINVVFDLGGLYDLDAASIWQFNYADGMQIPGVISTLDRGVKDFALSISTDGVTYSQVLTDTLARGTGQPLAAQDFAFDGVARYVRLNVLNNYAQGTIYERDYATGLSEVRFTGTAAVPEPATWALMIAGFGFTGAALRRRRTAVRFAA